MPCNKLKRLDGEGQIYSMPSKFDRYDDVNNIHRYFLCIKSSIVPGHDAKTATYCLKETASIEDTSNKSSINSWAKD
jgi:hypothetical protein